MRILFLCGCLEPGKDGVGDYSRRLAGELIKRGVRTALISVNDHLVSDVTKLEQLGEEVAVSELRLSYDLPWAEKRNRVKEFIAQFTPDWISLQYVPYAFHPKGLPLQLAGRLRKIYPQAKWHIMFHELWVGKEDGFFMKVQLLAYLQKSIICNIVAQLKPAVLHTHLPEYRQKLQAMGWVVNPLPLFSNIEQLTLPHPDSRNKIVKVAFFSQMDNNPAICRFLKKVEAVVENNHQALQILLLGGSPARVQAILENILPEMNNRTTVVSTGFLSPFELSEKLSECSLGITPLPKVGLGKSGSVAAFLEHSLPVGVPVTDDSKTPFFYPELNDALVENPTLENLNSATRAAKKAKALIGLSAITNTFITDLQNVP